MGAGPSRRQESVKYSPAPQLLKAQLKKSPAEEGAGISSAHIKAGASDSPQPLPKKPSVLADTLKVPFAHSDSAGAGIRPKTYIQTCTHKTHVQKQKDAWIHAQVPAEALEARCGWDWGCAPQDPESPSAPTPTARASPSLPVLRHLASPRCAAV